MPSEIKAFPFIYFIKKPKITSYQFLASEQIQRLHVHRELFQTETKTNIYQLYMGVIHAHDFNL